MPDLPGSDLGLAHLRDMLATVDQSDFSPSKLGRWLGWAQCAVVASGVGVTLADMKGINMRWADASAQGEIARPIRLAAVDRLRRLCENHFDVLEIEDDEGTITKTAVVRAVDVLAAVDDPVSSQ